MRPIANRESEKQRIARELSDFDCVDDTIASDDTDLIWVWGQDDNAVNGGGIVYSRVLEYIRDSDWEIQSLSVSRGAPYFWIKPNEYLAD